MSKSNTSMPPGALESLRHRVAKIAPFFPMEGTWRFDEVEGADNVEMHGVLERLIECGALRVVDETPVDGSNRNIYRWNKQVKERLESYYESLDRLPCGCPVHIYNDPELPAGVLSCKHCKERGEQPEYRKEQVQEWL